MNLEETLIYLECLLVNDMNPIYLQVDFQQEFVYIFIVCDYFKHYSISERISSVFSLLKVDCPSVLKEYSIAAECFSEQEFTDMLKMERSAKQITNRKK